MSPTQQKLIERLKSLIVIDARQGKPIDWTRAAMRVAGYPEKAVSAAIEEYVEEYGALGGSAH